MCPLRPQKPFNTPPRPFNPQFRLFTVNHLARRYPHAILGLLLSVAEKGAPPFVRYLSIFTTQHSPSLGPSVLRVQRLPQSSRNAAPRDPYLFAFLLRYLTLLTPSKSSHPKPLLSRQHFAPISTLAATLMDIPASVANKRLTAWLSPLYATLTKNRGEGERGPKW